MRYQFGAGTGDFVVTPSDGVWAVGQNATITFWSAAHDGVQYTDLTTAAGDAVTSITSDTYGAVPSFFGPDGIVGMWAEAGGGSTRAWMVAREAFAPSSTTALESTGLYVRPGWGGFWRAARAAAGSGSRATIAVVGGSATVGFYASDLVTKNWPALLAASLQTAYGDGGSGYRSAMFSANGIAGQDSAAITAWTATGSLVVQSGTWSTGGYAAGPGWGYTYSSTNGNYVTFTVRGTSAVIYTLGSDGGRSSWAYSVDGGSETTVTDTATTGLAVLTRTITGLSAGTHTVKIRHAGTTGQYLSVLGVSGTNDTGVVLHNLGRKNAIAVDYNTALRTGWNGGPNLPADLVLYVVSPEDVINGVDADTWAASVRQHLANIRDGGSLTGATDVVLVLPHIGTSDALTWRYQDYVDRAHSLAIAHEAALVNLWSLGRNSWNYWSSLGYWGNSASPGAAGTDAIQMSDAGHAYTAAVLSALLKS
ncbi:hypothetical protein JHN63_01820 [Streptomyces sp. MBT65]|uniref:hypothetical protein n=1 Tax=Streptomyces sp. MBT65 TaxID=1488395 RepID=UPI00190A4EC5|nr:hypothetical protein [Streptomyces sp. MBT65]MBK3572579.1 hypothetical protein [Streptomyces sp. MBT65]